MTVIDNATKKQRSLQSSGGALHTRTAGLLNVMRRFMTVDNTAAGTRDMNVLGTLGAPVRYRIGPPAGQKWGMAVIVLAMSDNGQFVQSDFGGIAGPLANGVFIGLRSSGVDVDIFSGFRVKSNSDWFGLPAKTYLTTWAGPAQTLEARFDAYGESGQYVILDGDLGQELFVQIQDDLTGLTGMRAVARYVVL